MAACRVIGDERTFRSVQAIDGRGGGHDSADALIVEVVIQHRRDGEKRSRGERGDNLGEVKGHPLGVVAIFRGDARHVALAGPTGEVPLHVVRELSEATGGNDGFDARLEEGGEDGVVAAEGMADAGDTLGVYRGI